MRGVDPSSQSAKTSAMPLNVVTAAVILIACDLPTQLNVYLKAVVSVIRQIMLDVAIRSLSVEYSKMSRLARPVVTIMTAPAIRRTVWQVHASPVILSRILGAAEIGHFVSQKMAITDAWYALMTHSVWLRMLANVSMAPAEPVTRKTAQAVIQIGPSVSPVRTVKNALNVLMVTTALTPLLLSA